MQALINLIQRSQTGDQEGHGDALLCCIGYVPAWSNWGTQIESKTYPRQSRRVGPVETLRVRVASGLNSPLLFTDPEGVNSIP